MLVLALVLIGIFFISIAITVFHREDK